MHWRHCVGQLFANRHLQTMWTLSLYPNEHPNERSQIVNVSWLASSPFKCKATLNNEDESHENISDCSPSRSGCPNKWEVIIKSSRPAARKMRSEMGKTASPHRGCIQSKETIPQVKMSRIQTRRKEVERDKSEIGEKMAWVWMKMENILIILLSASDWYNTEQIINFC